MQLIFNLPLPQIYLPSVSPIRARSCVYIHPFSYLVNIFLFFNCIFGYCKKLVDFWTFKILLFSATAATNPLLDCYPRLFQEHSNVTPLFWIYQECCGALIESLCFTSEATSCMFFSAMFVISFNKWLVSLLHEHCDRGIQDLLMKKV